MKISRRGFFAGLASALVAPAIVKASSLMPIKAVRVMPHDDILNLIERRMADAHRHMLNMLSDQLYGDQSSSPMGLAKLLDEQPKYMLIGKNSYQYIQRAISVAYTS